MGIILGLIFVTLIVLALNDRYWVFSAFLFGFYETIPWIRFTGAEFGALILVTTFFVRQALHRDFHVVGSKQFVFAALPFMAWMLLVWFMNPVGMFVLGSEAIGGRFYFKVLLAFLSLFCLSQMRFNEQECKLLGFSIGGGYLVHAGIRILFGGGGEQLLGAGTHYTLICFSFIAPLFLCRYSLPELFHRFWPLAGFIGSFGAAFYSGNRTAAARPVLVGMLSFFFLKKDRAKTVGLAACFLMALTVLVAGQGSAWHLPFAVQRPLSFLPGQWDQRLETYGFQDDFRAELRFWAREHIRERPWFGDGGFSLNLESMVWANANRKGFDADIAGHVLARNWHNVWLGMAADFGIPLSVFWGWFMAVLMLDGFRRAKRMPSGTWWQTMYLYFYLLTLTEFVNFFFNGGHTALTAQQLFLWAGLMTAVSNGVPQFPSRTTDIVS